jgi:molybdopterin synthase catalytic subunit
VGEEGERLDVRARGEDELEEVLARLEPLGRLVEVGEPEDAVVGFVGICRRESQETVLRLYIQPYLDLVTNK